MYYKCANDIWGYCVGAPEWDIEPNAIGVSGHCRRDSKTCSKHQTFLQSLRRQIDETKISLTNWSEHEHVVKSLSFIQQKEKEAETN